MESPARASARHSPTHKRKKGMDMSNQVNPIPSGFHTLTPHLVVKGASKAIEFYKKAFGAEEICRLAGPDGTSIMHADLKIGDSHLMLVDEIPDMDCWGPQALGGTAVTIHLYLEDVDTAFGRAVAAGAKVRMPLANMFWGDRYGMLVDPFGHAWSLATHKEDLTPEEIGKRAQTACSQGDKRAKYQTTIRHTGEGGAASWRGQVGHDELAVESGHPESTKR
jgi:uncharacterized glyoxalase superfamily protein PhnB